MEANKRTCKTCLVMKNRIQDGSFNYKDKRWLDETGRLWNGSLCPDCNAARMKEVMKSKRSKV